jgi:hypothetical protein
MRLVTLLYVSELRLVSSLCSEMSLITLLYVSEMRLVTFLFVVSTLFDYGTTLPCLTAESKKDFTNTRNALKSLVSYLSKTVKTLDKDLIAIEGDFKGRFSLFNFKI